MGFVLFQLCLLTKQQKWLLHNSDVFTANILNEEQCRELKMGSYLAVPAASADPPFFIHLVIDLRVALLKPNLHLLEKD